MDIEYERVRSIKEKNGEKLNDFPTSLSDDNLKKIYKDFFSFFSEFKESSKKKNIKESIDGIIKILYTALDGLATSSVYPSLVMDAILFSELSKVWNDGKLHYDKYGNIINPKNWKDPLFDIDDIVCRIELGIYEKENTSIEKVYKDIKKAYDYLKKPYSNIPASLNENRISYFLNKMYNDLLNLLNCDYKEEEIYYLCKIMYSTISMFVEMGINPKIYFDDFLDDKENRLSKSR